MINKARLRILAERDQLLNELFDEVRGALKLVSEDKVKYRKLLRDLLLQSFLQLMEEEVSIQCREVDVPLVQEVLDDVKEEYEKMTHRTVSPVLDHESYLPKTSAGGVTVYGLNGRIKCANTLESRVGLL
jgi:V-type H+-transporting ATPase subunit E